MRQGEPWTKPDLALAVLAAALIMFGLVTLTLGG